MGLTARAISLPTRGDPIPIGGSKVSEGYRSRWRDKCRWPCVPKPELAKGYPQVGLASNSSGVQQLTDAPVRRQDGCLSGDLVICSGATRVAGNGIPDVQTESIDVALDA